MVGREEDPYKAGVVMSTEGSAGGVRGEMGSFSADEGEGASSISDKPIFSVGGRSCSSFNGTYCVGKSRAECGVMSLESSNSGVGVGGTTSSSNILFVPIGRIWILLVEPTTALPDARLSASFPDPRERDDKRAA